MIVWSIVGMFILTAITCYASISQVRTLDLSDDSDLGLKLLLFMSGSWCLIQTIYLLTTNTMILETFYIISLTMGLVTVASWLYFCSAFSGFSYHKSRNLRILMILLVVSITSLKVTNPMHGLYFDANVVSDPITHIAIETNILYAIVTTISYILCGLGVYMLYKGRELRRDKVSYSFIFLLSVVLLPALLTIGTHTGVLYPIIPMLYYDPIGVGFLAVSLVVYSDYVKNFETKMRYRTFIENLHDPIIIINRENNKIVEYNNEAGSEFNKINESILGEDISNVFENYTHQSDSVRINSRFYDIIRLDSNANDIHRGAIVFQDETDIYMKNKILNRNNQQFQQISAAISHEIRNSVQIIEGHVNIIENEIDSDRAVKSLDAVRGSKNRIISVGNDLSNIARTNRSNLEMDTWVFQDIMSEVIDNCDRRIAVKYKGNGQIRTNKEKFKLFVNNSIKFSEMNGANKIVFDYNGTSITVQDDGDSYEIDRCHSAFEYGDASPTAELGSILPVVKSVCISQGWEIKPLKCDDGFKFSVENINVESEIMR